MTALVCPFLCFHALDPGEGGKEPEPWEAAQGTGLVCGAIKGNPFMPRFSFLSISHPEGKSHKFISIPYPPNLFSLTPSSFSPLSSSRLSVSHSFPFTLCFLQSRKASSYHGS